jgi:bifunctional DNA-binding transcriptional regulator/antitoxin component of YhaV-PrlF toxin-antitoxin module
MSTREYHVAVQARGTLALPADLRKRHHLDDPGAQVLVVERADGVIELHPLAPVPAGQRWFWTERWQRMEREADEDIAAGRVRSFEDVDDLLSALDG